MFLFLRQALDIINVISSRSTSRGLLGKPPAKTILAARSGLVWINFKRKYSHKHRHRRILLEHYNFLSFVAETLRNSRQNTQSRNKHTHNENWAGKTLWTDPNFWVKQTVPFPCKNLPRKGAWQSENRVRGNFDGKITSSITVEQNDNRARIGEWFLRKALFHRGKWKTSKTSNLNETGKCSFGLRRGETVWVWCWGCLSRGWLVIRKVNKTKPPKLSEGIWWGFFPGSRWITVEIFEEERNNNLQEWQCGEK